MKPSPDVVAIAKKRRHALLLRKLGENTLTKSELAELEKFEADHAPKNIAKTRRDAAKHFNVSIRTIAFWIEDGCPVEQDGTLDLNAVTAWKQARNEKNNTPSPDKVLDLKERVRWRKAKADLAELELKERSGQLIKKAKVEADNIMKIIAVKQALMGLPNLAPLLVSQPARNIETTIRAKVEDILNTFSGAAPTEPAPEEKPPVKTAKKIGRPKGSKNKKKVRTRENGSTRLDA